MNVSCLVKDKVDKMKKIFSSIAEKNKLQSLVDMSSENRIVLFEEHLTKDEAVLLNNEFEKSVYNEKLSTWVRKNVDQKYMENAISQKQKASIKRFITSKLFPGKGKIEIIPVAELKAMSNEELDKVLKENFKEEELTQIKKYFKKAVEKQQAGEKPKMTKQEKALNKQISNIERYLENNAKKNNKVSIPVRDILKMPADERMKFLTDLVGSERAKTMNENLLKISKERDAAAATRLKILTPEQKTRLQRAVIDRFIAQKKRTMTRISIPMNEILKMTPEEQLSTLKKIMPEKDAIKAQENIQDVSMSSLERDLKEKMGTFKSVKEFEKYVQNKLPEFAYFKEGAYLSESETDTIITKASDVSRKKIAFDKTPDDMNARMDYGRAKDDLLSYAEEMKAIGKQTPEEIAQTFNSTIRALNYGGDIGTTLIQGGGVISRGEHLKGVIQGFKNLKNEQAIKDMRAYIISDPLYDLAANNPKEKIRFNMYANELAKNFEIGTYKKLPESVKNNFIKKGIYGANEAIAYMERYTASMSLTRLERFKTMYHLSEDLGYDMSKGSKELTAIIRQTNTETGSARLSIFGMDLFERNAATANALMSSARLFATKLKTLSSPVEIAEYYATKAIGKETRLSKTVVDAKIRSFFGIATFSATTSLILAGMGYKTETNPKSSDFGKANIFGSMVDTTLGYGSYITFLTRFITGETASNGITKSLVDLTDEEIKAGKIRAVDSHGAPLGRGDITASFMRNKLSQLPSAFLDFLMNENNIGQKPTISGEMKDKILPLFITDMEDIMKNDKTNVIEKSLISIVAFAGAGNYTKTDSQWEDKTTNEMINFRARVGEDNFKKANKDYNNAVLEKINSIRYTKEFKSLTEKDKADLISSIKEKKKKEIFKQYPFSKYPIVKVESKKAKSNTAVIKALSK